MTTPLLQAAASVVSARQAAKECGTSHPRVCSWIYQGLMPARRGPGKCYSISRDDLDAFKAAYPELLGNADHNANTQSNG